jgi:hypothetical protein
MSDDRKPKDNPDRDPKPDDRDPNANRVPERLSGGPREGESVADWFRRTFGEMPGPTAADGAPPETDFGEQRHDARMALLRSVPPHYRWARFSAPELAERVVEPGAIRAGQAVCQHPRVCLVGPSRSGKTSLAVAMLWRRVSERARPASFIPVHRLGLARIQHAAGHGEPEIIERAMTAPLVLLDDVGCERDSGMNPLPDIVFERHAAHRPTWITTGLSHEQLVKRYGAGAVSRLFDQAKVIRLTRVAPDEAL